MKNLAHSAHIIRSRIQSEDLFNRKRMFKNVKLCWSKLDKALILGSELTQEIAKKVRKIQKHIKNCTTPIKELSLYNNC